ncbi:TPA: hypothetical protein ACUNF5_007124 [Burkholderia orbicola]|uniref:hypothetical protein n=1 Tax=Burkholderia orbicola TaxID=2978683 RepID=UPI000F591163|nr:hypothetical protein [Burkholderia orbicola]MDN7535506.1 hypothetical protein [Burkholderia orbicola]RQV01715.1 hypothetical protein DF039_36825 [Burkholderia cenocepacia]
MDSRKRSSRKSGRPGLTRDMLLPLPTEKVRSLSLEHHLALAAMRSGHGDNDQISCLLKAVYLAFFMREPGASESELEQFRRAERVLERCIERVERGERWWLLDTERSVLERVLVLHDEQLAAVPTHRYLAAWTQLRRFIVGTIRSPIPRV